MVQRFLARVGTTGAILILVLAVVVTGFAGGVVEHFRLASSQQEQQGEQSGEAGAQGDSQEGDQGKGEAKSGSQQEDQAGTEGESKEGENTTSAGRKSPQNGSTSQTK